MTSTVKVSSAFFLIGFAWDEGGAKESFVEGVACD
jgi:hypothetical protein